MSSVAAPKYKADGSSAMTESDSSKDVWDKSKIAFTSVTERRVKPIEEAAEVGQWKHALKECEKCQKKAEKSDRFLALKALVLAHQQDEKLRERGRVEALQLARREPVPTNQRAIDLLVDTFDELSLTDESNKLWQRAISQSDNKDLAFSHMWKCIAKDNWLEAQKSLASFKKAFPKERQYEFWNVVMCFLVHLDPSVDEKQRALFGTLAYRMLVKLAEAVPTQQDQLLALGKSIVTAEELYFLVYVYLDGGYAEEAVQLLSGPKFDENSIIGKQDPQLRSELLLKALTKAETWDKAFSICIELLKQPEHVEDDRVWDILLTAEAKANTNRQTDLEALLADYTAESRPHNRSAFVARMKHLRSRAGASDQGNGGLLSLCKAYFSQHQAKPFVFTDLLPILSSLDRGDQELFRKFLCTQQSAPNGRQHTNEALMIFDRCIESPSSNVRVPLRRAREAAELYDVAHKGGLKATNVVILAALDLCHSSVVSDKVEYILRAIVLLELGREQDPDAFHLSVLLIECYVKLGAFSQALGRFAKLSIKNLQMESVAHLILSRISSIHPQEAVNEEFALDPIEALDAGIDVITRGTGSLEGTIRMGLQNGSYSQIINTVELKASSRTSMQRWLYAIETNKIMRLNNKLPDLIAEPPRGRFADLRDYSFLYRLTEGDDKVHEYLRGGPKSGGSFTKAMLFVDNVANFLIFELAADANLAQTTYGRIKEQAAPLLKELANTREWKKEMTKAETMLLACALLLRQVIVQVGGQGSLDPEAGEARQPITEINRIVADAIGCFKRKINSEAAKATDSGDHQSLGGTTKIPVWEFLHESYSWLEVCQTLALFLEWMRQQKKQKQKQGKRGKKVAKKGDKNGQPAQEDKDEIVDGEKMDAQLRDWIAREIHPALSDEEASDVHRTSELISSLHSEIRECALQMIDSLSPEDVVVGRLVDVVFAKGDKGRENEKDKEKAELRAEEGWNEMMQRVYGEEDSQEMELVEKVCRNVVKSWVEAVEGILQIKVKPE
ncbi:hypothetical protein DV736_g97, partial [Chaetothyriales sp. CBS 134916]